MDKILLLFTSRGPKQSGTTVFKLMPEILELVRSTNGDNSINSFPTFFVDSDFEKKDQFSSEEINRLISWVHQLQPIDVSKVKEADPNIKEIIEEEDIRETKSVEGNVENIKKEYFKRNKEIHPMEVFLTLIGKKQKKQTMIMFLLSNY